MKISLDKLFRYGKAIQEVIDLWERCRGAPVGTEVEVPSIRTRIGKQLWEKDAHKMRRLE